MTVYEFLMLVIAFATLLTSFIDIRKVKESHLFAVGGFLLDVFTSLSFNKLLIATA